MHFKRRHAVTPSQKTSMQAGSGPLKPTLALKKWPCQAMILNSDTCVATWYS